MFSNSFARATIGALAISGLAFTSPANAQFRQTISHSPAKCNAGKGPAVKVQITGISASAGKLRVQLYRGTKADWLKKGRWLNRIEVAARKGSMTICMPVPKAGTYGIAVRHDKNGNGKTDLTSDGGAMSNNPSINIFNLGKPSYKKTRFTAGSGVTPISIRMRYM